MKPLGLFDEFYRLEAAANTSRRREVPFNRGRDDSCGVCKLQRGLLRYYE
jgi:hypothetical protein